MMARQLCKEEFRFRNFFYYFEDETAFYRCQWKWPRCVYVTLRVLLAAYTVFGFIFEVINYYQNARILDKSTNISALPDHADDDVDGPNFDDWDSRRPWFVYFTNWTYMVQMAHMVLAAVLSILVKGSDDGPKLTLSRERNLKAEGSSIEYFSDEESEPLITAEELPYTPKRYDSCSRSSSLLSSRQRKRLAWYFKLSWLLSNITSACAPIVTTIFFMALYEGGPVSVANTNVHILNTVFVVVDHLVSARPVRLLHWPAPVLFGACYTLFSYIFWTFNHVNHVVYKGVLDWNDPAQAVGNGLALAFVVGPLLHSIYFLIYRLKLWLFHKIYTPQSLL